jgi:hypothetical protein
VRGGEGKENEGNLGRERKRKRKGEGKGKGREETASGRVQQKRSCPLGGCAGSQKVAARASSSTEWLLWEQRGRGGGGRRGALHARQTAALLRGYVLYARLQEIQKSAPFSLLFIDIACQPPVASTTPYHTTPHQQAAVCLSLAAVSSSCWHTVQGGWTQSSRPRAVPDRTVLAPHPRCVCLGVAAVLR